MTTSLLLLLVYSALGAVAAFLFVEARNAEAMQKNEQESAEELYVLSERLNTTLRSIGDGVISTSFWWLRWTVQSRSSKAKTLPYLSAMTWISMWRTEVSRRST